MEYTGATAADGGLAINAKTDGFSLLTDDLASGNALPVFDMPQASYAMLRTWYGVGAAQTGTLNSDWLSPYQNSLSIVNTPALNAGTKQ